MFGFLFVFFGMLIIVIFAISNTHAINLKFLTGDPFRVRLVYLVLTSYLLGVATSFFYFLNKKIKEKRKKKDKDEGTEEEDF